MPGGGKTDNPFFNRVYTSVTAEEIMAVYDDWADSYDETVLSHGYVTPQRCAAALAGLEADRTAPVLDIGCGTGISGMALQAEGFTEVVGSEVNERMLEKAAARGGVYRETILVDVGNPFDFERGTYRHMTAMGVIATGHATPSIIADILDKLAVDGLLVFSLNDHTMEDPEYVAAVDAAVSREAADIAFDEYGDHMPVIGLNSRIIALRKR